MTRDENGSGTVFSLALICVTLVTVIAFATIFSAQSARSRTQTALDLAALEGARAIARSHSQEGAAAPCIVAGEVAIANNIFISECTIVDTNIYLIGQIEMPIFHHPAPLHIRSHAHLSNAKIFKFDN